MRTYFLLFMLALCGFGYAQSVDPLTGLAIVNVPLTQFSAYGLSVSLSLGHHGGALKVNEGPGNAGMGWTMYVNGGLYLMREVRGLPDETTGTRKGWNTNNNAQTIQNFTPTADDNLAVCTDETADWNFLNTFSFLNDPEPDVYYFNIPGYSGKYIFGTDGKPKMIPFQDIVISDDGKTITTNDGMRYTFNTTGDLVSRTAIPRTDISSVAFFKADLTYFQASLSFVTNFGIKTITNLVNNKTVDFTYTAGEKALSANYVSVVQPSQTTAADTLYYLLDEIVPQYLTKITLASYAVDIAYSNNLVDKVTVTETETGDARIYDLIYKAISSTGDTGNPKITKPFLVHVKQQLSCEAHPSFVFTYEGIDTTTLKADINWRSGYGEDIFGYYNGQTLNRNIPTIYYYSSETGANRFRTAPISGVSPTQTLTGGDRSTNAVKTSFGALRRMYSPAGGFTEFEYEPNKYYAQTSVGEELAGPGVRVKKVTVWGGEMSRGRAWTNAINPSYATVKTYEYGTTDANTQTSGKILYPPVFAFTNGTTIYRSQRDLGPGASVLYGRVRELVAGQGYTVYEFDLTATYADATATTSKIARATGASCTVGTFKNGSYTFPFAPLQDVSYARGLLTKTSQYTEAGVLTGQRQLTYITPQAASNVKGLRMESITVNSKEIYFYSTYNIPVNQSRILSQEVVSTMGDANGTDATVVTNSYAYNAKNRLIKTTSTSNDGSVAVQDIKYADDFTITTPTAGDSHADAVKKLSANNRGGTVVETYSTLTPRGGVAAIAGATHTLYKDDGSMVIPYRYVSLPKGKAFTPAVATTGATQGITIDTDYVETSRMEYANYLPANELTPSLVPTGIHYASKTGTPLASFTNCLAEHAVYDGFDQVSARGLTPSATPPAASGGWTGRFSATLNTTYTLNSAVTTKGENSYRIACRLYGPLASTLTVKAKSGGVVQATLTLTNSVASQWQYLEGFLDMSAVSPTFTLEVSSNKAIALDEFVALPKMARVSAGTFMPLTGATSQMDDRGNSAIITYDALGRKSATYDAQRNLVALQEYRTQRVGRVWPSAMFTSNKVEYIKGQIVTFTAAPTCLTGVTYQWTFTDKKGVTTTATGATATKVFSSYGLNTITLTATSPNNGSDTFSQTICVVLPNVSLSVGVSPNATMTHCNINNDADKTFTANFAPFDQTDLNVVIYWKIYDAAHNEVVLDDGVRSPDGKVMTLTRLGSDYYVSCKMVISGGDSKAYGRYECNSPIEIIEYDEVFINYTDDRPCP